MSLLHADLVRLCDAGTCAEVPRADHKLTTAQVVEVRLGGNSVGLLSFRREGVGRLWGEARRGVGVIVDEVQCV